MDNLLGEEPASTSSILPGIDLSGIDQWQVQAPADATLSLKAEESTLLDGTVAANLKIAGIGDLVISPPESLSISEGAHCAQVWVHLSTQFEAEHTPELVALFDGGKECSLGALDFLGWHLLLKKISHLDVRDLAGLAIRGLVARDECEVIIDAFSFSAIAPPPPEPVAPSPSELYDKPLSMAPKNQEEITNSIEQDGISFLFEARSLSAVVRFIYTPIEGTFSDIELEINNSDPIIPAQDGGLTIEMGGREWAANDENIERHFVSCEKVGDCVEARWQWKLEDELADFLYRFSIQGKSFIIEMEAGNDKTTGVSLGHIEEASQPRLIDVPYFNLGDNSPQILCTSGVFVSSLLDWYHSRASTLYAPLADDGQNKIALNGGCTYIANSDGKRNPLQERWFITVSRQFEEVLPSIPAPKNILSKEALKDLVWYPISNLSPSEETYVESYEHLLNLKEWGMDQLLVIHPASIWSDNDSNSTLTLNAAPLKGGDDALSEYLEALVDLGYVFSLYSNYRDISPLNEKWAPEQAALLSDGNPATTVPGAYLLKPSQALSSAADHMASLTEKFNSPSLFLGIHTASPPWERIDCDSRLENAAGFLNTFDAEQNILATISRQTLAVGEGGSHWLYPGLLHGSVARQRGPEPCRRPLLVDFALRHLHPLQIGAGLGSPEQFFGANIPGDEKHSTSPYLDRYLATTVAYGHAAYLPAVEEWGLPTIIKTYYMLQKLQASYLAQNVDSIRYHQNGNYLDLTEAIISGTYELSQLEISYENGLKIFVNGSWTDDWALEHGGETFNLPPASFWAQSPDGLLVYSADSGQGRIDYAKCPEYIYCDTRGTQMDLGPICLDGAALIRHKEWEIDVYPLGCSGEIKVEPTYFWPDRRLPRLRLLAFKSEEEEAESLSPKITDKSVIFQQVEGYYKYRITLPEWMVEPGK